MMGFSPAPEGERSEQDSILHAPLQAHGIASDAAAVADAVARQYLSLNCRPAPAWGVGTFCDEATIAVRHQHTHGSRRAIVLKRAASGREAQAYMLAAPLTCGPQHRSWHRSTSSEKRKAEDQAAIYERSNAGTSPFA